MFSLFFLSSIVFLFLFWFFVSFVFTGVRTILPKENRPPVRVWVSFKVRARIRGKFSMRAIALEPFLPVEKRRFFARQRNFRFHSSIIRAKLHLFVDTK